MAKSQAQPKTIKVTRVAPKITKQKLKTPIKRTNTIAQTIQTAKENKPLLHKRISKPVIQIQKKVIQKKIVQNNKEANKNPVQNAKSSLKPVKIMETKVSNQSKIKIAKKVTPKPLTPELKIQIQKKEQTKNNQKINTAAKTPKSRSISAQRVALQPLKPPPTPRPISAQKVGKQPVKTLTLKHIGKQKVAKQSVKAPQPKHIGALKLVQQPVKKIRNQPGNIKNIKNDLQINKNNKKKENANVNLKTTIHLTKSRSQSTSQKKTPPLKRIPVTKKIKKEIKQIQIPFKKITRSKAPLKPNSQAKESVSKTQYNQANKTIPKSDKKIPQQQNQKQKTSQKSPEKKEEKEVQQGKVSKPKSATKSVAKKKSTDKIVKRLSSFQGKKFQPEEIPNFINQEFLDEKVHELDEFQNFKERYLGKEGAFSRYKVLIAYLYTGQQFFGGFDKCPGQELKKRGFQYDLTQDEDELISRMMDYDIVWIITYQPVKEKQKLTDTVQKYMQAKKSLFLWSDNDPLFYHTNAILETFFDGMKMQGNYYGDKNMRLQFFINKHLYHNLLIQIKSHVQKSADFQQQSNKSSIFDGNHKIFYGVNNLYEGITISHPINIHPDFKVIAYNTNNEPLVIVAEESENHGRIVLDCGFTKLYDSYWQRTPGTQQYISNANVWLTGIPE